MKLGRLIIVGKKPETFKAKTFYILDLLFLPKMIWVSSKQKEVGK